MVRRLDIPIVYEAVERARYDTSEEEKKVGRAPTAFEKNVAIHSVAFVSCTVRIEQAMRAKWPKEIAQMVAEDNDQVRQTIKGTH